MNKDKVTMNSVILWTNSSKLVHNVSMHDSKIGLFGSNKTFISFGFLMKFIKDV